MSKQASTFTPGPWATEAVMGPDPHEICLDYDVPQGCRPVVLATVYYDEGPGPVIRLGQANANARLIAAAPDLYDGCNALLGLLQLICARDDMPEAIRKAIHDSHRVTEAERAVIKATAA